MTWVKRSTVALAVMASSLAFADIGSYGINYYLDYEQVSDSEPVGPPSSSFSARIDTTTDDIATAGDITYPDGSSTPFIYAIKRLLIAYSPIYSDPSLLLASYPAGKYVFNITGGPASPDSATIDAYDADLANETPYLIGGTYSALQMAPAGLDAPIAWNTFTHNGPAPDAYIGFNLINYTEPALAFSSYGPPDTYLSDVIPGSTLKSGRYYSYEVNYVTTDSQPMQGFGGSTSYMQFSKRAYGYFKIAANPGTISGQILLQGNPFGYPEPIVCQLLDDSDNVIEEQTLNLGYYGYYAFDTAYTGTARFRVKGTRWLSDSKPVDLSVPYDHLDFSLLGGDIDNDNSVTVFDYGVVSDYFDKSNLDADWSVVGPNGFAPVDADLDNDGSVTVFDYGMLSDNFDLSGN